MLTNTEIRFFNLDQEGAFEAVKKEMIRRANDFKIVLINATQEADEWWSTVDADGVHSFPFTKIKKLGAGGFGSIWKARGPDGKIYIAKFQTMRKIEWKTLYEWKKQSQMKHKNILSAHSCFVDKKNHL